MADLKMMLQNLRDKSKCCKKDDFTGERYTIIHDMSIETLNMICEDGIEQLENAQTVNRWIPVEDALPEKAGNYLCTLYYAIPPYNLFHPEKDTYIREVSVKFFDGKSFIASVVAWMPLPDAYEPPEKE